MAHTLAAIFVPIGIAGAAIALICALIMAFALARRAAGLVGGAAGVWIVGALLSWASSFAEQWLPLLVSAGALGAALVVGALMRVLLAGVRASKQLGTRARASQAQEAQVQQPRVAEPQVEEPPMAQPRTQPARVTPAQVRPSAPVTDVIRAAA